ncbi:hypothetical protein HRW12_30145 [Streptomyces lunaelactis]|uniref:hypothetical protein n=1 Tax=Streptomyces lunaelactis TaxID=1535768 RepID=UPI0015848858|nr:hypothetical protein [Streptomyces lunaelactis]NUK37906.1 hypothetical protein [Streptomyces lunaelactis]
MSAAAGRGPGDAGATGRSSGSVRGTARTAGRSGSPGRAASVRRTVCRSVRTSRSWRTDSAGPKAGAGADGIRAAGASGSCGADRSASTRSNGPGSRGRTHAAPPAPPAAGTGVYRASSRSK